MDFWTMHVAIAFRAALHRSIGTLGCKAIGTGWTVHVRVPADDDEGFCMLDGFGCSAHVMGMELVHVWTREVIQLGLLEAMKLG